MDSKSLFLSISNITKNILICYKRMAMLDEKGMSSSLEYEKCLRMLDELTKIEDYYYSCFFNDLDKNFSGFVDLLVQSYSEEDFNKIRSGKWYLLFREVDDDLLCGYRMYLHVRNSMAFNMISNTIHKEASDAYRGTIARKNNLFLSLIKEVKEDSECTSHKKEINKALYDFSFIYKIDKDAKLSETMGALDNEEIRIFDKLCRKIVKLNESAMSSPKNFRSLSLNTCYLKSLLIVMPLLMSNKTLNQINSEDAIDKEKCGYKALQSLIRMAPELKGKYNRKNFTLKRKF